MDSLVRGATFTAALGLFFVLILLPLVSTGRKTPTRWPPCG
jgi:hypothetical protein